MWKSVVVKFVFFIVGFVIGGGVVFGIIKLNDNLNDDNGTSESTGSRANSTLKYMIVISRHGNKGGSYDYPLDPYLNNNTEYWPYGSGQLTPYGRVQEYNLGAKLRSLYNGFLNTSFSVDDVFACTDLYQRTMMSGELVLAGLYPPEGWQVWNQNVNWQPIPLYTNSSDRTNVINSCERYKEIEEITYEQFTVAYAANLSEAISYVYNSTGQTLSAYDLTCMYEKLAIEETEGYTLPYWTTNLYPYPLSDLYGLSFIASCASTDEMVGLWIGDFQKELLDTLKGVVNGSLTTRRLSYYSAHDSSLLNLQVALGIPRSSIVSVIKTGSAIVVELHQDSVTSQFYVQTLYIDGSSLDSDPLLMSQSDCGEPCYFDSFLNTTERFNSYSYEEECQATDLMR